MGNRESFPVVIACDFDGTLCEDKWPNIGLERRRVIRELLYRQEKGAKIVLWTCRTGFLLERAVAWCKARGIEFDAVNENLPEYIDMYGNDCRKVYAHEYWDDKAVMP